HVLIRHDVYGRQIASAQEDVRLHAVGEDEHFLIAHTQGVDQRPEAAGLRLVVLEPADHVDRVLARARVERTLSRQGADLPRHVLRVAARNRTEDGTTTDPVRRAGRARARASGALLLPRLLVAPGHVLPDLRRRVALAVI